MRVEIYCAFCAEKVEAPVPLKGWRVRYETISDEHGFCPKHAAAEDFFKSQCPGCVAGWPECPLFRAFAYSRSREMSEADFTSLRRGVCPKRVNGTFMVMNDGAGVRVEDANISEVSPAGAAIESAIRDYIVAFRRRIEPARAASESR